MNARIRKLSTVLFILVFMFSVFYPGNCVLVVNSTQNMLQSELKNFWMKVEAEEKK